MNRITGLGIDMMDAGAKTYTSANVTLAKTHSAHMDDGGSGATKPAKSFKDLLFQSLDETSAAVQKHEQMREKSIIDPDSVNAHDVALAGVKARISVQMVSSVVNRALEAYRAIIALR